MDNLEVFLAQDLDDRFEADCEPNIKDVFFFAGCREVEDAVLGGPDEFEACKSTSLSNEAFRFENAMVQSSPISTSISVP